MGEFGSISWESETVPDKFSHSPKPTTSFDSFLRFCETKVPNIPLSKSCKAIEEQKNHLKDVHTTIIEKLAKEPLLASFVVWAKEIGSIAPELLEGAKILLEHGFIGTVDTQGAIWTIQKARRFNQSKIIDAIRCRQELPIALRESLVRTYISFIQWLWEITYGYINKLEDPDYHRSLGKSIPHPAFIRFLDTLANDKAQLVAKLLYFGGNRTLEEVLSLDLDQVDFKKHHIKFDSDPIEYPEHVFSDIKALMQPRKKGRVFEGRQKAALNPKTIFRNFQDAASRAGLGPSFTVKRLTMKE